jgi:ribosomal protein S18 acetylase RimI-like enzyme
VTIRIAGRGDVDAILGLWARARSPAATTPDDRESVERLIAHSDDAVLIAERDGHVVGALIAAWDGWRGNMYRLAVLPAYRRRGLGRRLVEAGHERLRAKGARRISALVGHEESDATAFWHDAGYAVDEQIARFVRNL